MDFVTFKHSFNAGDAVTMLPALKRIWKQTGKKAIIFQRLNLLSDYSHNDDHPIKDARGRMVCMNEPQFGLLKPLLEYQDYIQSADVWNGEKVDFDIDLTRHNSQMPLPGGNIYFWPTLIFPQLIPDFSGPWITVPDHAETDKWKDFIIVNRTERYRNPYINYSFLSQHEKNILFLGTGREHDLFCNENKLNVLRLNVPDFLYLAELISKCRFFIGNQSFAYHVAEALGKKRILEVCSQFPNTFPALEHGHPFISQNALEYFVTKLLKETNGKSA